MPYYNSATGELNKTLWDVRLAYPNVSFPEVVPSHEEFSYYRETTLPDHDSTTQKCIEVAPESGLQQWRVVDMTPEEIEATAAQATANARAAFVASRAELVAQIKVTVDGMVFDGDETSQTRMARALIGLADGESLVWVLANNAPVQVSKAQLCEALRLAGQAQAALWVQA